MNTAQLEAFVKYAASKGLEVEVLVYSTGYRCSMTLGGFPAHWREHRAPSLPDAIEGAFHRFSEVEGAPPEPRIWWRTLQIREAIEQAEASDLHMDFALTFELVRLEPRGLPELRALLGDTLRPLLREAGIFEDAAEDLADVMAAEDLPALVNQLDGLLAWASEPGDHGVELRLLEALRGVL